MNTMSQIARERRTETRIRAMVAHEIVAEIHRLEDEVVQTETAAREREKALREALEYAANGLGSIHNALMSTGPKQACGEMTAHFLEQARAALAAEDAS